MGSFVRRSEEGAGGSRGAERGSGQRAASSSLINCGAQIDIAPGQLIAGFRNWPQLRHQICPYWHIAYCWGSFMILGAQIRILAQYLLLFTPARTDSPHPVKWTISRMRITRRRRRSQHQSPAKRSRQICGKPFISLLIIETRNRKYFRKQYICSISLVCQYLWSRAVL